VFCSPCVWCGGWSHTLCGCGSFCQALGAAEDLVRFFVVIEDMKWGRLVTKSESLTYPEFATGCLVWLEGFVYRPHAPVRLPRPLAPVLILRMKKSNPQISAYH
jgi:hypothetical protein